MNFLVHIAVVVRYVFLGVVVVGAVVLLAVMPSLVEHLVSK